MTHCSENYIERGLFDSANAFFVTAIGVYVGVAIVTPILAPVVFHYEDFIAVHDFPAYYKHHVVITEHVAVIVSSDRTTCVVSPEVVV